MPPLSKFNPNHQPSSLTSASASSENDHHNQSLLRNSYDSKASTSSQDSHISSMSTGSEFEHQYFAPQDSHTSNQNVLQSNQHRRSSSSHSGGSNSEKALPSLPEVYVGRSSNMERNENKKRCLTFACEKPLPEAPAKHPHLTKLKDLSRRQKLKRTSSREGGYVWYANNSKRIHEQCAADGVCDMDQMDQRTAE